MKCFIRVSLQNHPAMMTNLLYPAIPAVDKLLLAHTPVPRDVEDHKQVADLLGVHPGYLLSSFNFYQARARRARARRACALRALGLLLADGTPTVGGGKTF